MSRMFYDITDSFIVEHCQKYAGLHCYEQILQQIKINSAYTESSCDYF